MHSHNYTMAQAYKRSFGEARAWRRFGNVRKSEINWPRTVLLGWMNDVRRDFQFCAGQRRLAEWPHAARIRWQQRRAKLDGFREAGSSTGMRAGRAVERSDALNENSRAAWLSCCDGARMRLVLVEANS